MYTSRGLLFGSRIWEGKYINGNKQEPILTPPPSMVYQFPLHSSTSIWCAETWRRSTHRNKLLIFFSRTYFTVASFIIIVSGKSRRHQECSARRMVNPNPSHQVNNRTAVDAFLFQTCPARPHGAKNENFIVVFFFIW